MTSHVDDPSYPERVYAGVLGKLLGVYLGRPVEGWPYERIRQRFGEVDRFVAGDLGEPIVVADDDVSASFGFARTVLDFAGRGEPVGVEQQAATWLNYVIENRTVLWWGGLGRSTEHTALVNLLAGVPASQAGTIARNGATLAEQIGAQIFHDAFSLLAPGDPELAIRLSREAACVSHDGVALDVTGYLAAARALGFVEPRLDVLLDEAARLVDSPRMLAVVDRTREICAETDDWRAARDQVDAEFGYGVMPGPCHALSNLAITLVALVMGGDDFRRSIMIASSAGFDTDSNAGLVGMFNGVRLGLRGIDATAAELRRQAADRALVVSAEGGEAITDAVLETRKLVASARVLAGLPVAARAPRFGFDYPGSVQGFDRCPVGVEGHDCWSTPTFLDPANTSQHFRTVASPTLYPGQTVRARLRAAEPTSVRLYALTQTPDGIVRTESAAHPIGPEPVEVDWAVPASGNYLPYRLGYAVPIGVEAALLELDWTGAPAEFAQRGIMQADIWDLEPIPLTYWVCSADVFEADYELAFAIAHRGELGVATIGTRDWDDYEVAARLRPSIHRLAGLVARARGQRRWYAAVLSDGQLQLLCQSDAERRVLASAPCDYQLDQVIYLRFTVVGDRLSASVAGQPAVTASDTTHRSGAAGLLVEEGSFSADEFVVRQATNDWKER